MFLVEQLLGTNVHVCQSLSCKPLPLSHPCYFRLKMKHSCARKQHCIHILMNLQIELSGTLLSQSQMIYQLDLK